jgi:hypothetical protein
MGFSAVVNGMPVPIKGPRWVLLNKKERAFLLTPLIDRNKIVVVIAKGINAEISCVSGKSSNTEMIITGESFSISYCGSNGKMHKMFFVFSEKNEK